jgi:mRNA interferase MazF
VAGQRPRQGWIYFINPYRVSLQSKSGHVHIYNLDEPGELECQTCSDNINSSRVFRGTHPYMVHILILFGQVINFKMNLDI